MRTRARRPKRRVRRYSTPESMSGSCACRRYMTRSNRGLITPLVAITREKGLSAYVGGGNNRFPAAHVTDVARLYRLALEKGQKGARYNAVAEEGISVRTVAEILGKGLNVPVKSLTPEEAPAHFGWMAMFAGMDLWASGAKTQARLDWHPTGPSLVEDLERMDYSVVH